MFGKVFFPRRVANASPCLDFIIADMFRSVLSNGERIFGKFWGRVLRKDDVKAVCKTLPHTIYFIFYRLRCVFASFLIFRRASFLFFEIRKPQEVTAGIRISSPPMYGMMRNFCLQTVKREGQ